ncbi:hypothetical protein N7509_002682 [Penicillium cosmopolitanum]|uniref:Uncharacterized protein n=1 Tax=Penicillium cosmopolitanum TaxID=1131564 RepID=A0A9W9W9J6_9EURO|nr:uncharacterized protein N7509_002682 [Penicillium cosmopolitanum]KAJ5408799.1 hypothetical protein N7509_002682 [Penicillium cosmopolitanum]
MPFVQEICTSVDARAFTPREGRAGLNLDDPDAEPFEPQRLDLHELFSAYPNIESLSVSINRLRLGCIVGLAPSTRVSGLPPETTFPPLRSLPMSGYNIAQDEEDQPLWAEKFPWHKLRSLTLGRQLNPGFLKAATGKVDHLKQFEITGYEELSSLDAFLSSFNTLESLTVKEPVPSVIAMAHHSDWGAPLSSRN